MRCQGSVSNPKMNLQSIFGNCIITQTLNIALWMREEMMDGRTYRQSDYMMPPGNLSGRGYKNYIEDPFLPPSNLNHATFRPPPPLLLSWVFFLGGGGCFFKISLRVKINILALVYLKIDFPADLMLKRIFCPDKICQPPPPPPPLQNQMVAPLYKNDNIYSIAYSWYFSACFDVHVCLSTLKFIWLYLHSHGIRLQ